MKLFVLRRRAADEENLSVVPTFGPVANCRGPRWYHTQRCVVLDGRKRCLAYRGECRAYEIKTVGGVEFRLPCAREASRWGWHYGRHRHADGHRFTAQGRWPR